MKSVLIASRNPVETQEMKETINRDYNISVITSPGELDDHRENPCVVLLDQNFTEQPVKDFLTEILKQSYLPVIIMTSPNDVKEAFEAMKLGACNYIVKVVSCQLSSVG